MLLVQKYLEEHSFSDLVKEHGVYASFSKSGHKWSLNYDQIEARESDPLSQECRGLILSCDDGNSLSSLAIQIENKLSYDHICPGKTKILAYPMRRFFNYGQGSAANINWSDPGLSILEKLDGTLCIMYYDSIINQWCVATRSVSEANILLDNGLFTFRTLFEKALQETANLSFDDFAAKLNRRLTYCFELTTPYNRVVVNYSNCRLTLLSARNIYSYEEIQIPSSNGLDKELLPYTWVKEKFNLCGIPFVRKYTYTSVQELVDWVSTLNPMESEGVVVLDSNFNRIKIKNAAYVAYNKLNDRLGTSERNCLEIILSEKDDDVISFLPEEIAKNLIKIKSQLQTFIHRYDDSYSMFKTAADAVCLGDKKTFALMINEASKTNNYWSAPFFQMFAGKAVNMKDFIQQNKKDGTWSNGFLDRILEISKNYNA
jgi:hypothetical protein